jgi:hypothetical protein
MRWRENGATNVPAASAASAMAGAYAWYTTIVRSSYVARTSRACTTGAYGASGGRPARPSLDHE